MSQVIVDQEKLLRILRAIRTRVGEMDSLKTQEARQNSLLAIEYDAWYAKNMLEAGELFRDRSEPNLRLSADEESARRAIYSRLYSAIQDSDFESRHLEMDRCAMELLRLYGEGSFVDTFEHTDKWYA